MKTLQLKSLILLGLCCLMSIQGEASFGDGRDGPLVATASHYTDNVRSKVLSYSNSSAGAIPPYTNTLTIVTQLDLSSNLVQGDLILIVDMLQGGRNYDLAIIDPATSGTSIVATCLRTDLPQPNVTTGSKLGGYTQVIRIPQYEYVDLLGGGVLTCHQWDDLSGTGGILAFYCEGTLTFDGGIIDTRNKGQEGYLGQLGGTAATSIPAVNRGTARADAGNGGSAGGGDISPVFNHRGGVAPVATSPGGASCNIIIGAKGGCGGNSKNGNTVAKHGHIFSTPSFSTLTMNFGRGGAEGESGQGPGAGGHGGAGGGDNNNNVGTDGYLGFAPAPGSRGGAGGNGGRGGGMTYIKAYEIDATGQTGILINTSGGDGLIGTNAVGDGGHGGAGGEGGDGSCGLFDFTTPGGGGGHGTPGNGGDGGDGGNGGDGGGVWILYNALTNFTSAHINTLGGNGGPGGTLGSKHGDWGYNGNNNYSYFWQSLPPEMTPPLSNGTAVDGCYPGAPCPCKTAAVGYAERVERHDNQCTTLECVDCDDAMELLSIMTKVETISTGTYRYSVPDPSLAASLGVSLSSYCIKVPGGLYAWHIDITTPGTCSAVGQGSFRSPSYFCDFSDPALNADWELIASNGLPATVRSPGSHYEWHIGTKVIRFDIPSLTLTGHLGGAEDACTGSGSGTPSTPEERPRDGYNGDPGEPGSPGEVELNNTPPSSGNPWKKETGFDELESNLFALELSPNPANNLLTFTAKSPDAGTVPFQVTIYDLNGKIILEQLYQGVNDKSNFNLDVTSLASGSYIFSISQSSYRQDEVLIIEK